MNKTELIDSLAERVGDRKTAANAVEGLVDVIVRTVNKGDKVTLSGFGVFEKRARAARKARNPRTGATVRVKKTSVPAFRPGTAFREVVSGTRKLPRATPAGRSTAAGTTRTATGRATAAGRTAAAKAKPAARSAAAGATTAAKRAAKPAAGPVAKAADQVAKVASGTAKTARSAAKTARKTASS